MFPEKIGRYTAMRRKRLLVAAMVAVVCAFISPFVSNLLKMWHMKRLLQRPKQHDQKNLVNVTAMDNGREVYLRFTKDLIQLTSLCQILNHAFEYASVRPDPHGRMDVLVLNKENSLNRLLNIARETCKVLGWQLGYVILADFDPDLMETVDVTIKSGGEFPCVEFSRPLDSQYSSVSNDLSRLFHIVDNNLGHDRSTFLLAENLDRAREFAAEVCKRMNWKLGELVYADMITTGA
jgi:hypothetical protein